MIMTLSQWQQLSKTSKHEFINDLMTTLNHKFIFSRIEEFSLDNMSNEIAILIYEDREFAFIPGMDSVTLGWDSNIHDFEDIEDIKKQLYNQLHPLEYYQKLIPEIEDEQYRDYYQSEVDRMKTEGEQEYDDKTKLLFSVDGLNEYILEHTSPVRTKSIPPMIVERKTQKIDNLDEIHAISNVNKIIDNQGFVLPSEDQWEYMCGSGTRTLFPFGNRFQPFDRYKYFYSNDVEIPEPPNQFGLYIAYSSQEQELVNSPCLTKGGDGGRNINSGMPICFSMLPNSTFWRNNIANERSNEKNPINEPKYFRRVIVLETRA